MDYEFYLFTDEKYGNIYTNYLAYYNRKLQKEKYKKVSVGLLKMMFACLFFTIFSVIVYGISDIELFLCFGVILLGLGVIFAILSALFLVKGEDNSYIRDFKFTKEYANQVEEYNKERTLKDKDTLFEVIREYNELEKQKEETSKNQEIIVKLNEDTISDIVIKMDKTIAKNIITALKIYLATKDKITKVKREKNIEDNKNETNNVLQKEDIVEEPLQKSRNKSRTKRSKREQ